MYQVKGLLHAMRLSWGSEPLANCRASLSYLLGFIPQLNFYKLNPQLSNKESKLNPTLLLHGNYHNQSAWLAFAKHMQGESMGPLYTVNLASGAYSRDDKTVINDKIEQIKKQYTQLGRNDVKINLIGHSRGAVMAFYMSLPTNTWNIDATGNFVMISKPKNWRDDIGLTIRLAHPTTEYEKKLILPPMQNSLYDITAKEDTLITTQSALSPSHQFNYDCGHLSLLYLPAVHQQLLELIKAS